MSEKENKKTGRPKAFKTPELLWEAFKEYEKKMTSEKEGKPLTVSGFCNYVESYKNMLNEYSKDKDFSGTIKKIYSLIENDIETGILTNKYNATAGIFNLKNNFGWKDKQELVQKTHNINETYEEYRKRLAEEKSKAMLDKQTEDEEV